MSDACIALQDDGAGRSPSIDRRIYLAKTYQAHYADLQRQLTAKLSCKETAADIIHSAFVVFAELEDPHVVRDPKRYLFRVALNLASNHFRDTANRRRLLALRAEDEWLTGPPAPCPEESTIYREHLDSLADLVRTFPKKRRQAMMFFLFSGLNNAEIADKLGITESTLRAHVATGLKACRAALEARSCFAVEDTPYNSGRSAQINGHNGGDS